VHHPATLFGFPDGRPITVIPEVKEVPTGVWYFTADTCDKMRASHVLSSYLLYLDTEYKEQRDAANMRRRSSALDSIPNGPDPSTIVTFQQSMWALPPAAFRMQLQKILETIPTTFALAHLPLSLGSQDALFLSAEAVRELLHARNYDLLIVRRQVASVCSTYNQEFSVPTNDSEIIESLLIAPSPPL